MKQDKVNFDKLISLYESAISQSNHEGDLIWQKFNAFIVTHGIFFALLGGIITTNADNLHNKTFFILGISIVGLFLSSMWLVSTIRGYDTLEYWKYTGIEIANKIFQKVGLNNYYKRGNDYFMSYDQVHFDFGYKKPKLQRNCLSRKLKIINTRRTAYFSILTIIVVYFVLLTIMLFFPLFVL